MCIRGKEQPGRALPARAVPGAGAGLTLSAAPCAGGSSQGKDPVPKGPGVDERPFPAGAREDGGTGNASESPSAQG